MPAQTEMQACRALPAVPGHAVVALAFRRADSVGEGDDGSYDIDLAIVKADGTVVRRMRHDSAFESDALRFSGLLIDTGRYDLAPDVRAFGVRINHASSSRANPGSYQALSLYIDTGKELRQVLGPLQTQANQGEWDTQCAGSFSTSAATIDLALTSTNGFRDLVVTSREGVEVARQSADECLHTTGKPTSTKLVLRYNGRHYSSPAPRGY